MTHFVKILKFWFFRSPIIIVKIQMPQAVKFLWIRNFRCQIRNQRPKKTQKWVVSPSHCRKSDDHDQAYWGLYRYIGGPQTDRSHKLTDDSQTDRGSTVSPKAHRLFEGSTDSLRALKFTEDSQTLWGPTESLKTNSHSGPKESLRVHIHRLRGPTDSLEAHWISTGSMRAYRPAEGSQTHWGLYRYLQWKPTD